MATSSQKKNQLNLRDALQVTDNTDSWTVIVQVLIKYPTKPSKGNPNLLYKKFLFTDMKGTRISAITFAAIDHFDTIFQPFKRYSVTNASVKVADPRYKIGDYNYTWTLYPRTHVQLIHDPIPYVCPYSFGFMKFSEMFKVADRDVSIAVKGLIVHSIHVPHSTKPFIRDYIVIDEEKRPMILRLWADLLNESESGITEKLPQPTFIAALDLKVTTHNGLSLTTGFNPHFMIDPPLRETEPLLTWYNDHVDEIRQLIQGEAYKSTDILLPPPPASDIVPIKQVSESMEILKTAWVAPTIHLMPGQSRLWHTICDKCKKTVSLPVGSDLPCMYCKKEMNVEPRCHVHVFLNDDSGTVSATLFSSAAEKFIGYTAVELLEAAEQNSSLNDAIAKKIDKKRVQCFLKDHDRSFESRFEKPFPIVKLYAEEEIASGKPQEDSILVPDAAVSIREDCAFVTTQKEKQLFSPSTKSVIDEIATTIGVDAGTLLSPAAVKRGITFGESSDEAQNALLAEKVPSPTHESVVPVSGSGSESPVKKLKNLVRNK